MSCPSDLFSSIFNKRWFSLAISSCWFLKMDFTGLLNFSINFSQGGLSVLLEGWQRGVIGNQVRLFKVIVALFLLLFSNWSMQNVWALLEAEVGAWSWPTVCGLTGGLVQMLSFTWGSLCDQLRGATVSEKECRVHSQNPSFGFSPGRWKCWVKSLP